MSTRLDQLTDEAMNLSPRERVELAERIWESIDAAEAESAAIDEAVRRDEEMSRGDVQGLPREEVMARLRKRATCE